MKRQTDAAASSCGFLNQGGGFVRRRAKLGREMVERIVGRRRVHSDNDSRALRAHFLKHFVQLVPMVDHEVPDAVDLEGRFDDRAGLHRMHEVRVGFAEAVGDLGDFRERSGIEVAHPTPVQGLQHQRVRIALHRVKDGARELTDEPLGGGRQYLGPHAVDGIARLQRPGDRRNVAELSFVDRHNRNPMTASDNASLSLKSFP